jgi:ATP-dependent DNA helicase HFM1/MER3
MITNPLFTNKAVKCVYVAPTKVSLYLVLRQILFMLTQALCTEKHKEWTSKFGGLGIHSLWRNNFLIFPSYHESGCELTGDTVVFGKGVWGDAKNAQIM